MSRVLFVTWDGAGNVGPALAVATELASRGHDVEVLGHTATARAASDRGADFVPFTNARQWNASAPGGPLAMINMLSDADMGREVLDHARRNDVDMIVVDCLLFGVMRTLRNEGIPYVVLEHLCDGYLRRAASGPMGLALRLKGLHPLDLIDNGTSRMTMTVPELDSGHGDVTHVGPAVSATPSAASEPAVLISLSTYAFPGMKKVWERILDAVDGLPARVVATTGPQIDPNELRVPANVEIHGWLDHSDVLPKMTLVVGHGGHGTTIAALAHGVPVLVMPLDSGSDQPFMGDAVAAAGAGQRLDKKAKPAVVRSAVEQLMVAGAHREAAGHLGHVIRGMDGRRRGAELIESLLHPTPAER